MFEFIFGGMMALLGVSLGASITRPKKTEEPK
jgi:hypothetical protein